MKVDLEPEKYCYQACKHISQPRVRHPHKGRATSTKNGGACLVPAQTMVSSRQEEHHTCKVHDGILGLSYY